jgi:uncharacterized protein (TIGR02246 family)
MAVTETDTTHAAFLPDAGLSQAWKVAGVQLSRPRTENASLDELREELALRDLIARYAYTWDQGDVDGVMRFFTDDCVMTNPRGTHSGAVAVREIYEQMVQDTPRRRHLFTNVVVRLSDDLAEGWLTAYHYAVLEPRGESPRTVSGLVADHLVKTGEGWKIRARSVSVDTMSGVVAADGGAEVVDSGRPSRRFRR